MSKGITSLEGFVRKLSRLKATHQNSTLFFRGHSKSDYKVEAAIFRQKNWLTSEHLMIRQMLAEQPLAFKDDNGIFDQLVRAQHYGLPTRLLDVTYNPMIALYFAVCSHPQSTATIVVFKPEISRQKYFDSDVVSCLSALSLMRESEKTKIIDMLGILLRKKTIGLKKDLLENDELEAFNASPELQKLVQLVRHEKPDFRAIIQPMDLVRPVSVIPRKLHARINAQNGAFILFGLAHRPTISNMKHIEVDTFNIEKGSKEKIKNELQLMGVGKSTLFPEIENSAVQIRDRYT